jgi:4-amino-4-deoxy-L-arabinose transferase-like glycosyltransferase
MAMCIVILIIYRLFKHIFDSERIGFVAALIALIGTSFSLWALTGKDHSLSLLFIMLGIYFYYSYVQSNQAKYKYLAFAMVGLEVWVRAEAAVPLFCALILTELLFVYRNNTARAQLQNIAKIVLVILISLLPFFINNYLLFGNIFFPPMKATADVIVTGKIDETAPFLHQIIDRIVLIVESVSRIPAAFEKMFGNYHLLPKNMVALILHNDDPKLMSILEVCPILIFALLMLYRFFVLLRSNARAILNKERYLPFLFLCIIIVHILIYSGQTGIDYRLGHWDYRYFMPIYIPLLYFAISALRVYNVFDKVKEVVTALASCIVILTPALIAGVCVFGNITGSNDFYTLCIMCKILAWIAIAFLAVSFGFLALKRSDHSKELFAYAIGFSIFSTFFWLLTIGFMWGKAPCAGFVLPVMNYLHGLIAYHAGSRFFMDTFVSVIYPAFNTIMKISVKIKKVGAKKNTNPPPLLHFIFSLLSSLYCLTEGV